MADQTWNQQASTVNQQQRRQIVYQMQQMILNERAYIVLNYPDVIDAYSNKWVGLVPEKGYGLYDTFGVQPLTQAHEV